MVGLFLLDLALPKNIPLLPYYFLMVVLSASLATPRQMVPLVVQAFGLAIISGLYWGFLPSIDYATRLLALTGVAAVALQLSAQRCREITLRRQSEQTLKLTFDNAAAGVALADPSGRLLRVNPALCDTLNRDARTLLTLSWPEISHPDDIAREQPLVEAMLANRCDGYRLKKRYLRGDGSTIWVDLSVSCVRGHDGHLEFFIGQAVDISAEMAAQEALASSEQTLRHTLDQCSMGLALCAAGTGTILQANSQLCTELNLTPAALVGSGLNLMMDALEKVSEQGAESSTPIDHAALEALLRGENDVYRARVQLLRDGRPRGWGDLRLSNLRDASGAVGHVLLEVDDITDIVAPTEYLQAAAAAGVVGIWDWDVPANVLTWHPVMYRLYGRKPGDFAGAYQAWAEAVHPEDRAYAEGEIQAALRGKREYAPRFRVIWPDGSVHHVQAISHTTYDREGQPLRMLGVNYDVTELVQTQQQLQAEQHRLSTTLDSLLDPHLMLGPVRDEAGSIVDLRILRANPAAAVYNNMALEDFVGARVRQFWADHVSDGLFDRYLEVLGNGKPLVLDSFPLHHVQQGGLRYFDIRAVKVSEELSVTWRDVSERIAMEQALERRAATDSLTTLLNREEVFAQMGRLLADDRRRGGELAVLFCDLDHFKEVNDNYGHQAGDAVLQAVAKRIRSCLRGSDLAARIGGDELMVVLPGLQGLPDALTIAEKLRRLASEAVPIPQGLVQVSVSVGVALACDGESPDELIARADTAMYTAKQQGRDQVVAIN
ncbi:MULTISPECIES: diguanylate cyclase [unclassified Cyanobium]|uniref:diguanylate cyclase n=1 Tax=unclassified Cyanobium TaxID=2627006 RepID=UPI0020CD9D94|nr:MULTISPECIES: diguanylate cyclase [unclassified Cyanobium]MCP9832803.1 diguanylate cyclase [Cyanobium sp. La Preciosa 7G6]MCP9935553.1 diguanylate cyclase [Cyanobium sp. Aljojuca 7A6]